jgi:hypothetical protein
MLTRYRLFTWVLLLVSLSACAATPQPASPGPRATQRAADFWCVPELPAGQGRIWIYRTAPKRAGVPPTIVVDGRPYEALRPGTAYTMDVAPGRHDVLLAHDKDALQVDVPAGADVFVRFDVDPALTGRGFYPVLVARPTAQAEIHEHTGTDFGCAKK